MLLTCLLALSRLAVVEWPADATELTKDLIGVCFIECKACVVVAGCVNADDAIVTCWLFDADATELTDFIGDFIIDDCKACVACFVNDADAIGICWLFEASRACTFSSKEAIRSSSAAM